MITTFLGYMTKFSIFILLTYFIASSNKQLQKDVSKVYSNSSIIDYSLTGFKRSPISLSNIVKPKDSNSSNVDYSQAFLKKNLTNLGKSLKNSNMNSGLNDTNPNYVTNLKESFSSEEKQKEKDPYGYGYLNTFYTELVKENLEYFVEPLPLQGIEEPPNSSSSITEKECMEIFDFTNKPTKEMIKLREKFKKLDKDPIEPFQKLIKDKKLKIKQKRLDKLVKDCAILSLKLKTIYNRGRPYQICHKYGYPLKYLKSKHADTPSYPSSYALQSYSIAFVLGRKYEKYQKEFEKIANDIAWSRVYSGNNFKSDIECSKKIVLNLRIYLESIEV